MSPEAVDPDFDLDAAGLCRKVVPTRSKYAALADRRCHLPTGHDGECKEFPFLRQLKEVAPRVAAKIERDSIMTTGAAWKSAEAGPNRILRWVMLESDESLKDFDINMEDLQPQVVAKLREKAAPYDSCVRVAMSLTVQAYEMPGAPAAPDDIREYLEQLFGELTLDAAECVICRQPIPFALFDEARRGKATIETCHKDARVHKPNNVGFAHRECNIAQGPKTLDGFYDWIEEILRRARPGS